MKMDEYLKGICKRFELYEFDADYICNLKGHASRFVKPTDRLNSVRVRLERNGENMSASKLLWEIIYQIVVFETAHDLTAIHIVNSEVQPHMELIFTATVQPKENQR